jgi:hypothetical protein
MSHQRPALSLETEQGELLPAPSVYLFCGAGVDPRASAMQGKCSATELH